MEQNPGRNLHHQSLCLVHIATKRAVSCHIRPDTFLKIHNCITISKNLYDFTFSIESRVYVKILLLNFLDVILVGSIDDKFC
eukprot:UN16007